MTMTASRSASRKHAAELQALKLLNLTKEEISHFCELQRLFQKSRDEQEKKEIIAALLEIINPDGNADVGNVESGVDRRTKEKVRRYHAKVGIEIRNRRIAKGLSQQQLAELAGIPQSHVSRLENGKHTPTHLTIQKLARALRTRPKMIDPGFDD